MRRKNSPSAIGQGKKLERLLGLICLMSLLVGCPDSSSSPPETKLPDSKLLDSKPVPVRDMARLGQLSSRQLHAHARSRSPESHEILERQLLGEPSARSFAAFGLGLWCADFDREQTVNLLASAVASWMTSAVAPSSEDLSTAAWAIGVCATDRSEIILQSWLQPDPSAQLTWLARAAARGLGAFADRRGKLQERTQSALLGAAAREEDPDMLLALGRVSSLSDAVGAHLLEVVGRLLVKDGESGRRAAVFALGRAGPSAAHPLAQVFLSSEFSRSERAAAAQAMAQLGAAGQEALDAAIEELLAKGLPRKVEDERWIPLIAGLQALEAPKRSSKFLGQLAAVPLPGPSTRKDEAARRRLIWLRCRGADLRAGDQFQSSALLSCDPERGRIFQLAQLRALDRGKLSHDALERWKELSESDDPVVTQAALRLLSGHAEVPKTAEHLQRALQAEAPGTKTTALQLIAAYPSRVFAPDANGPPAEVIDALAAILESRDLPLETLSAALSAAGASRALTLKPKVQQLCESEHSALWSSAETALSLLGSPKTRCRHETKTILEQPAEQARVNLVAETDLGPLELRVEPEIAPQSAAHFLKLVDSGYYDGLSIHGAREGFAVQFGDKNADGYDDERSPSLPHEVGPTPFGALSFGMGSFAPGTHHTQLFVVVTDAPQLLGTRVRLGSVQGPWDQLVVGDVIHHLRRK